MYFASFKYFHSVKLKLKPRSFCYQFVCNFVLMHIRFVLPGSKFLTAINTNWTQILSWIGFNKSVFSIKEFDIYIPKD